MSFISYHTLPAALQRFPAKLAMFCQVVGVVLLQDMRTRFGSGNLIGYALTIAIPLGHLAVITTLYYFRTMVSPVGDSPTLFVATGALPYIICIYPARNMSKALYENRQLLNIPILQPIHIMTSRCILEMLNAVFVMSIFLFTLYLFDQDITPLDTIEAAKATAAALILGVGFGLFSIMLCGIFGPFAFFVVILSGIIMFALSGVYIPAWSMPDMVREYNEYNPIFQLVEWVRSSYFTAYDMPAAGKFYVIGLAGILTGVALLGERMFRGKFLA